MPSCHTRETRRSRHRAALLRTRLVAATFAATAGMLSPAQAQSETEPNDSKATADAFLMPGTSTSGAIVGASTSATGAGLDYFRVSVPTQPAAGFYRHRLIAMSATPGHTLTIRGLQQFTGSISAIDRAVQTSAIDTTPQRFIQWYTTERGGDIYVAVTGAAVTTANYSLDYEVAAAPIVAGPNIELGAREITTFGETSVDTDFWVYDGNRIAIPGLGNDDLGQSSSQSRVTDTFAAGTYFLAISDYNLANNLASPEVDAYRSGDVLDFPGVLAQSSPATGLNLNTKFEINVVPLTKTGPFDIAFVRFTVAETPRFRNGFEN